MWAKIVQNIEQFQNLKDVPFQEKLICVLNKAHYIEIFVIFLRGGDWKGIVFFSVIIKTAFSFCIFTGSFFPPYVIFHNHIV